MIFPTNQSKRTSDNAQTNEISRYKSQIKVQIVSEQASVVEIIRDFTNQNATLPGTSPEVIFSQSASLRMFGAELQRVFFTFRARGLNFQRFQKT